MSLAAGQRLLHYTLVEKIGEGGMGVVWKARDTTLDRDVALKVLPNQFLDDAERRARFEREAKLLASLSHANIAGIFGLHEAAPTPGEAGDGAGDTGTAGQAAETGEPAPAPGPVRFITMELVPGEDLAQRLARGALPVEQALGVARQIAEALETAHDSGVIHRDLKPANIKLGPEDQVKVLDFGLAKAFEADPSGVDPRASLSPTLTSAGTRAGMLLGTAAYMSPEQARGHVVDKRTDIFAFGAVLYEMLTARQAFGGETVSDSLAAILKVEPDWSLLPAGTPEAIRRLLARCMEKRPKQRLRDIGEARIRIEEELGIKPASGMAASGGAAGMAAASGAPGHPGLSGGGKSAISGPSGVSSGPGGLTGTAASGALSMPGVAGSPADVSMPGVGPARASRLPWIVAAVALVAAAAAIAWPYLSAAPPAEGAPVMKMEMILSEEDISGAPGAQAVLSPDGTRIAYVAGPGNGIHVRLVDQLGATALSGTDGAMQPFFSLDGQWIGFFAGRKLKKVSVVGGAPLTLCEVQNHRGGTWGPDDTIVFSPDTSKGLFRVPAAGGEPEELTTPHKESKERSHRWPHYLPGGRAVLFTVQDQGTDFNGARIEVLDLNTMERKVIQTGGSHPAWVPTGHLVYIHEGTMFAAPFDLETLEIEGSPAPVLEGVTFNPGHGGASYHFSPKGHLLYDAGGQRSRSVTLSWLDRDGNRTPALTEPKDYGSFSFSPDGTRLLTQLSGESTTPDLWVHDMERDVLTRLTFAEQEDMGGLWSRDGERVYFSSTRHAGPPNIYWKRADGTGEAERLIESERPQFAASLTPDGRRMVVSEEGAETSWDVLTFDLDSNEAPAEFLRTTYLEGWPALSPDGRWLVHGSNESGGWEHYVRPFPTGRGKWQISTDGAIGPAHWAPDGKELFYRRQDDLMVAAISVSGDSLVAGRPKVLVENALGGTRWNRSWTVHPDGQRFLVTDRDDTEQVDRTRMTLVLNWFEELKQRAPK